MEETNWFKTVWFRIIIPLIIIFIINGDSIWIIHHEGIHYFFSYVVFFSSIYIGVNFIGAKENLEKQNKSNNWGFFVIAEAAMILFILVVPSVILGAHGVVTGDHQWIDWEFYQKINNFIAVLFLITPVELIDEARRFKNE